MTATGNYIKFNQVVYLSVKIFVIVRTMDNVLQ